VNNVLSISATLIFLLFGTAFAQDAKLIAGAKKEGGKVVVYGSLDSDTGMPLRAIMCSGSMPQQVNQLITNFVKSFMSLSA